MADITMCTGKDCIAKDKCYRFTAKQNPYRQSMMEPPPHDNNLACDYFVDNSKVYHE